MLSKVTSHGLHGIDGFTVTIEVDVSFGQSIYDTVGLPDAAVRESRERVRAAVKNSGFSFPSDSIIVNLAPADMRKEGTYYDLPIALGIIMATGAIAAVRNDFCVLGELALDGTVRRIDGALPMVIDAAERGQHSFILPTENAKEVSYIEGIKVYPAHNLKEVADFIDGDDNILPLKLSVWEGAADTAGNDFFYIKGQQNAKRAAEIACAGGHNMLLIGTPGSGKTMLARSIPSILPDLTKREAVEITKLHSIAGLHCETGLVRSRPFRSPHHGASAASLVGGGVKARPGEISLAHFGVLFLDEFPEFKRDVLEALRQPLEDGEITVSRVTGKATYPANFMLVAAMNPCPCGNYGSKTAICRCTAQNVKKYQQRISGPMLDRIDLHVEMSEVSYSEFTNAGENEHSSTIKARVNAARAIQATRFKDESILFNAQMTNSHTEKYCEMDSRALKLIEAALKRLNLSARAFQRILKVSRTIADLSGNDIICAEHIAEAIQYRSLDNKYWGEGV